MSVLEYGTYLESNTRIVRYKPGPTLHKDRLMQEYVNLLDYLRTRGCTITPRAFIPKSGVMWLYRPLSSPFRPDIYMPGDSASDPRVLIQIISSLRNMYYADCDFDVFDRQNVMSLVNAIVLTKDNIAITTNMRDLGNGKRKLKLGDVTVLNVPYCMMVSGMFDFPVIKRGWNTYMCLKLIPIIMMSHYEMVVELGRYTLDPAGHNGTDLDFDIDYILGYIPGALPGLTVDDYLDFADSALREAIRSVRQLESYDGVYRDLPDDLIVASQDSVIVF